MFHIEKIKSRNFVGRKFPTQRFCGKSHVDVGIEINLPNVTLKLSLKHPLSYRFLSLMATTSVISPFFSDFENQSSALSASCELGLRNELRDFFFSSEESAPFGSSSFCESLDETQNPSPIICPSQNPLNYKFGYLLDMGLPCLDHPSQGRNFGDPQRFEERAAIGEREEISKRGLPRILEKQNN